MIQDWVEKAQAALNSSDQAISELHDRIREREQAVKDAFTKAMEHIGSNLNLNSDYGIRRYFITRVGKRRLIKDWLENQASSESR